MDLRELLREMLEKEASDLHLRVGMSPIFRIDGRLSAKDAPPIGLDDIKDMINQGLSQEQREAFNKKRELDLALSVSKLGRFRVNLYYQRGTPGMAIRSVKLTIPSFEELNLPQVVKRLAEELRGLILVTGTTGSGKSTTLATMVEHINQTRRANILTIEDPIEYVHLNKKSIVYQRELGGDTDGFDTALRQAFRQDPDVILLGEIRDLETMQIALTAADTGHLVLSTLHTLNAIETINRIISFFPPHQHQQIRLLLSGVLKAVISQRLLNMANGKGRVPAVEVLVSTGSVRDYLIDPLKTHQIADLMEEGGVQYGMQTFDQSILRLYQQGLITYEDALLHSTNPDDLELKVKGITGAADRRWTEFQRSEGADSPS